ncbi:MAG: hypothetical protein A2289_06895 [Deltaproteobacteria bacterium RIFOXYA12_FULL_58_15]|nr:MAG: hypothetical protein A2289_06895 [Deltaproteobacteria bacterium RIFOXYA12_FULL_58_15]OGR14408.1 MAG: hypothetical protein A2341_04635 [Deltaproteobacteria bacterium RIFOXYB12_FULL_58_9]
MGSDGVIGRRAGFERNWLVALNSFQYGLVVHCRRFEQVNSTRQQQRRDPMADKGEQKKRQEKSNKPKLTTKQKKEKKEKKRAAKLD